MWQSLVGHARDRSRSLAVSLTVCAAFIVALGWGQTQAQQLAALPASTMRIESFGAAKLIGGWVEFCHRDPAECAVDPNEPLTISLTPRTWRMIVATNRAVNGSIKPITDQEHWGVGDRWEDRK